MPLITACSQARPRFILIGVRDGDVDWISGASPYGQATLNRDLFAGELQPHVTVWGCVERSARDSPGGGRRRNAAQCIYQNAYQKERRVNANPARFSTTGLPGTVI